MFKRKFSLHTIGLACLLGLITVSSLAQQACSQVVNDALSSLETNCTGLGRNEACYGNVQVSAAFVEQVSDDFFTQPSDRSAIADLARITTEPLDLEAGEWGVAQLNLQANLPNTLPGQNVTVLLVGDSEVEDAVDPEEALDPELGANVTIRANANVRSGPGTNFNVIGGVEAGDVLRVDRVDESETWLRVVVGDDIGWVIRDAVELPEPIIVAELPISTPDLRTPMQAFFLRTGIGRQTCEETPDVLFVQGPQEIAVDLTVNGANIRIGSTILIRILPPGDIMEFIVLDGQLTILDDDYEPTDIILEAGERTQVCLTPPEDLGRDGEGNDRLIACPFSQPETIDLTQWCLFEEVDPFQINYGVDLECDDEATAFVTREPATAIGRTTTDGTNDGNSPGSVIQDVDCSNFSIPNQTIIATNFILDWPDVPGATGYTVSIFDNSGYQLQTIGVSESQLLTNGGIFPSEGYVDVRAFQDGEYACFARLNFARVGDPNPPDPPTKVPPSKPPFTAEIINCAPFTIIDATIRWRNAPGNTVRIFWDDAFTSFSTTVSGTNGTTTISGKTVVTNIRLRSGGEEIALSDECP